MIYLFRNGQQEGPFTLEQVRFQIQGGVLSMADHAWFDGCEDWKTVGQIPGIMTPPSKVDSGDYDEILWQGKPALRGYGRAWLWSALLMLAGGLGLIVVAWIFWDWFGRNYRVTRRSVIQSAGIFLKSTDEVFLRDIRSVTVLRKGISGLLGVATIEFSSAAKAGAEVVFSGILNPEKLKKLVNDLR